MRRIPFLFGPFAVAGARLGALLGALLAGLLVAMLLGGWGWTRPSTDENPQAAAAVRALTGDRADTESSIPADFRHVLGYQPVRIAGRVLRADGGCTSPWGQTRYRFGIACQQHDLGYDLLRYAAVKHQPLGGWARRAIDRHFARDVEARCSDLRCRTAARVYVGAVDFNSWRQGWGVPVVESVPALLMPGVAGLAVASAGLAGLRRLIMRRLAWLRTTSLGAVVGSSVTTAWTTAWIARVRPWLEARAGRLLVATAALALCLQPLQVPRPVWVQVVIGGAAAAQAYLMTGWSAASLRRFGRVGWVAQRGPMLGGGAVVAGAGAMLGVAAVSSSVGQLRLDAAVGRTSWSLLPQLLATPSAVLAAAAFVLLLFGLGRGLRGTGRALLRPGRVARAVLVSLLVPGLVLGVVAPARATTQVIGSELGAKGRTFLAGAATPTYPTRPVRVYVGRDQAASPRERAQLAVEGLRRAGGFERSVLLVVVPTGSGWVNSDAVSTLERLERGDTATVAVQYAASPSWLSYVRGGQGVQTSVRELLDAVHAEVLRRPIGDRPQVLVYGESLGAWGGLKAYPDAEQLLRRVDGALWVGVPAGVDRPTVGDPAAAHQLVVVHADDPVPAWTPGLLVHPTAAYRHGWLPGVSFWRTTADVIAAASTPVGHGHRYGPELAGPWRQLIGETP